MAKQNLLVVDDDARSRRVLEVTLRNAGYVVATAADGAEALARIETSPPALVLSDTGMPRLDGFELCRCLKADDRYRDIPFLFLTEQNALEDKIRGLELGAEDYLAKPMYIKEVVARVRIALQKRERALLERREKRRFYGSLEDMGVVDLLTTIELGRKSGVVRLERPPHQGRIWFADGRVVDAEVARLHGEDAVYRLLTWDEGTFEADFGAIDRPARVVAGTQQLLMEGMRRVDEWGRMLEQLPSIDAVFQVDYGELAERLADLPDEVNALLRLFDGHRSAMQAIDDSALSDLDALAAISRLYFEGIIYEAGAPKGDAPADERPRGEAETASTGDLRSWLSDMMAPAPEPEPDDSDFSDFKEDSGAIALVDELLTSVTSMPRVRPPEPPSLPPGALPSVVELPTGAAPLPPVEAPAGRTRGRGALPTDVLVPVRAPEPPPVPADDDARRVRDALQLEATPAPAVPPSPLDLGHDQFFAHRDVETLSSIEAEAGVHEEPVSKLAYVVLGVAGAAILAGVAFFVLRDEVEPREAPRTGLAAGWHEEALKARPAPGSIAPIEEVPLRAEAPPSAPASEPTGAPATDSAPASEAAGASASEPSGGPASAAEAPRPGGRFEDVLKDGLSQYQKGDYQQAASHFERAIALRPASEEALLGYANTLLELNRGSEAQRNAEKVAKMNPKSARAHLIIGTVRQEAGDKDAAVAAYRKYLELAPDDRYAEQVRWIVEHRLK